jgi:hypothetical protein
MHLEGFRASGLEPLSPQATVKYATLPIKRLLVMKDFSSS